MNLGVTVSKEFPSEANPGLTCGAIDFNLRQSKETQVTLECIVPVEGRYVLLLRYTDKNARILYGEFQIRASHMPGFKGELIKMFFGTLQL